LIARYDRDMFVIILPETSLDEAVNLGRRIQEQVAATPLIIGDIAVLSTVCVGIAAFHPTESGEPRTLVAAVETALHKAKSLGKNHLIALDTGATAGQLSSF
jgi:diguanylate cyclase (GGDEF)-like protein